MTIADNTARAVRSAKR